MRGIISLMSPLTSRGFVVIDVLFLGRSVRSGLSRYFVNELKTVILKDTDRDAASSVNTSLVVNSAAQSITVEVPPLDSKKARFQETVEDKIIMKEMEKVCAVRMPDKAIARTAIECLQPLVSISLIVFDPSHCSQEYGQVFMGGFTMMPVLKWLFFGFKGARVAEVICNHPLRSVQWLQLSTPARLLKSLRHRGHRRLRSAKQGSTLP